MQNWPWLFDHPLEWGGGGGGEAPSNRLTVEFEFNSDSNNRNVCYGKTYNVQTCTGSFSILFIFHNKIKKKHNTDSVDV